jgi:hypothetical protein
VASRDTVAKVIPPTHWKLGLLVGGIAGGLALGYVAYGLCHEDHEIHESCFAPAVGGAAIGAVIGGGLGALIGGQFRKREEAESPAEAACWPADSIGMAAHIDYFRSIVADTDSVAVATREAFELEHVRASEVRLIDDGAICRSAVLAVNEVAGTHGRARQVSVYSLGSAYAVEDPRLELDEGEYPFYLFDRRWRPKTVMMY